MAAKQNSPQIRVGVEMRYNLNSQRSKNSRRLKLLDTAFQNPLLRLGFATAAPLYSNPSSTVSDRFPTRNPQVS